MVVAVRAKIEFDQNHPVDQGPRLDRNRQATRRMFIAHLVFRCFRFVEKVGERFLGAVGPYFVAAAVALISTGVVCFCTSGSHPTSPHMLFVELP